MVTSATQDRQFLSAVINDALLEEAIEWIKDNLEPDEVFDKDDLYDWGIANGLEDNG